MKIAVIVVRVLFGLLLLMTSVMYFGNWVPQPELTGNMKEFNEGLRASGYLMGLIKGTEFLVGLALLTGLFVPLATVVMFPITVNIVLVHILLAPETLPVAIVVLLANLFLAYAYRKHYAGLFSVK